MSLDLNPTQLDRYSRHVVMDDVGPEGQARLLDAAVLCVGAGGLGSPVIQYLAAAGVGTLGIADEDVVELSNLQRQVIHGSDDVGRPKAESAAAFVRELNPDVEVRQHHGRVDSDSVEELIDAYDVVVDGSDNFPTRYLLNDVCTLTGTPLAQGAIFRFEGQVTTFSGAPPGPDGTVDPSDRGPCYRCLFPEAPPPGTVPDCATAGVLGVLPGIVGCIQATEVVKLILELGRTLDGRLLAYDAVEMQFDEVPITARPDCPVCGTDPITSIQEVTYEDTCAIDAPAD